jgi:hypothetical protein
MQNIYFSAEDSLTQIIFDSVHQADDGYRQLPCIALDNCSCIVLPSPIHGLVPPCMTAKDGGNAEGLSGTILAHAVEELNRIT